MLARFWIVSVLAGWALLVGCDRPRPTQTNSAPATQPAHADATTLPASRPATSTLLINGQLVSFPRARLVVQQKEPVMVLLLFSDDPRDAIDTKYNGNRYYMEIKLDIDDPAQLPAAEWRHKATTVERVDSPDGIFLEGDRRHLQPHDARMAFTREGSTVNIELQGQFLLFQTRNEAAPPQLVPVQGMLTAELEVKNKRK